MITRVWLPLRTYGAMPKAAQEATLRRDVASALYKASAGIPTVDAAHEGTGVPPFRLREVVTGSMAGVSVVSLDDDCTRVLCSLAPGLRLGPFATLGERGALVTAATTFSTLLEAGASWNRSITTEVCFTQPVAFKRKSGSHVLVPDGALVLRSVRQAWKTFGRVPLPFIADDGFRLIEVDGRTGGMAVGKEFGLRGFIGRARYALDTESPAAGVGAALALACWVGVGQKVTWGAGVVESLGQLQRIVEHTDIMLATPAVGSKIHLRAGQ